MRLFQALLYFILVIPVIIFGRMLKSKVRSSLKGIERFLLDKLIGLVKTVLIIMLVVMGLLTYWNVGVKRFDDFESFRANSADAFELPEGAEELKMAINNQLLAKTFLLSYVLSDDELACLIEQEAESEYYYGIKVADINAVISEEEPGYGLDFFPDKLAFDAVTEDSIANYTIIYYHPMGSGHNSEALLFNQATNQVLEFRYAVFK